MRPTRKLNRRSFFTQVMGGAIAAGAVGLVTGEASAGQGPPYTGITDSDSGSTSDHPGYGRGGSGAISDNDSGPNADPGGQGRNRRGQPPASGVTDRDPTDPRGQGRGATTGFSDSDRGPNADPSGRGRGTVRGSPYSGYSDSDRGQIHDAPGHGVGRSAPSGYTGLTDSDPQDRGGYGRGRNAQRPATDVRGYARRANGNCLRYSGTTDADSGAARDPSSYGHANGNNVVPDYYCR
jgi:hypothetical protein